MSKRGGFTAPELLAVSLLIAMAAGVVVLLGNVAQDRARAASCGSNLLQISIAMRMYASDNDYRMPPVATGFESVMPYMRNWSVLKCPSDPAAAAKHGGGETKSSYIMNPFAQADDSPLTIIAADNAPGWHPGRRWIGVRLDGAAFLWPKDQWEEKIGWVMRNGKTSNSDTLTPAPSPSGRGEARSGR